MKSLTDLKERIIELKKYQQIYTYEVALSSIRDVVEVMEANYHLTLENNKTWQEILELLGLGK